MLQLCTLGKFDACIDSISLTEGVEPRRGLLLVYLAEQTDPQMRSKMAQLLWPHATPALALNSLRVMLSRMRHQSPQPILKADRTTIAIAEGLEVDCDVAQVRRIGAETHKADEATLRRAADLYQGSFLSTCPLDGFPELDEWASSIRAEAEMSMVRILHRLLKLMLRSHNDAKAAVGYAEQLVELAPDDDEIQGFLLEALTADGQLARALQQFAVYRRNLPEGNEVGGELTALMAKLTRPEYAARLANTARLLVQPITETVPSNKGNETESASITRGIGTLRAPLFRHIEHPLIGRRNEVRALFSTLDNGSRLVTLVGLGGAGKTFFVRSQIETLQKRFGNRIYFTDLRRDRVEKVQAADTLFQAIAAALHVTPQEDKPLFAQVVSALSGDPCCLVLDNFETVQPAAMSVLDLLQTAPQLTILVTSRIRLHLSNESIVNIGGLSLEPQPNATAGSNRHEGDAVSYFIQCVHRYQADFCVDDVNRPLIYSICRLVEGLPLAIELAAMQLDFYTLAELADRIAVDSRLLTTGASDLPEDHYSIRAVLDSMWQALNEEERIVLTRLSVFADVWHREAMQAVVAAAHDIYTKLINASLLRVEEPAWFSLHPLVKQYAAARLPHDSGVAQRHAHYFLHMLDLGDRLYDAPNVTKLPIYDKLRRQQADIMAAWEWAVAHRAWNLLDTALVSLGAYLKNRQQREEGIRLFTLLVDSLPAFEERSEIQQRLAGRAAFSISRLYPSQGGDQNIAWRERAIAWLEAAGNVYDLAAACTYHAHSLFLHSNHLEAAIQVLSQAAALADTHGFDHLRTTVNAAQCYAFTLLGKWTKLQTLDRKLDGRLGDAPAMMVWVNALNSSATLDEWSRLVQRISHYEKTFSGHQLESRSKLLMTHFRSILLSQQGDLNSAIALLRSILGVYARYEPLIAQVSYAELAFWQASAGDIAAARTAAQETWVTIKQRIDDGDNTIAALHGLLFVAATTLLTGDATAAKAQLLKVLAAGQAKRDAIATFGALYHLTLLHAHQLPPTLYRHIIKIAAVSPTMHFILRPLARGRLLNEGIVIQENETAALWATDLERVIELVQEVEEHVKDRTIG